MLRPSNIQILWGVRVSCLEGKIAVVTGISGGLGSCVALSLHNAGCQIAANDGVVNADIVVNCCGVYSDGIEACLEANLIVPYMQMLRVIPWMVSQKWGRIVNVASALAYRGNGNRPAYAASKHAMLGLSRSLAIRHRADGIRVICVSPEAMQTKMGRDAKFSGPYETFLKPESVARIIVQLMELDDEMAVEEIRLTRMASNPMLPG